MAEVCKDIDQGLADLQAAINRLNNRLDGLERKQNECCKDKDKPKDNDNNNSNLEKRVKELEKTSEALKKGIVGALNNFADIEDTNREFLEAFQGVYEMVTPLVDVVSTIIDFFGGDSE
jgi:predicted RNase H-like nuclease (RuvC/YqgF family)